MDSGQLRKESLEEIELLLDAGDIGKAQELRAFLDGREPKLTKIEYDVLDKIYDQVCRQEK